MTAANIAQFIHGHHLHHKTCPAREMLRPLTLASFRVILLPCKSCFLPALVHRLYEVLTETVE